VYNINLATNINYPSTSVRPVPTSVFSVVKPKIKILKAKGAKLVTTSFDDLISIAKCTMFFTTKDNEFFTKVHRESDVDMTAKPTPCTRCLSSVFSVVKPKIKILKAKGAKLVTTSFDDLI
jgi:hypothetical protein